MFPKPDLPDRPIFDSQNGLARHLRGHAFRSFRYNTCCGSFCTRLMKWPRRMAVVLQGHATTRVKKPSGRPWLQLGMAKRRRRRKQVRKSRQKGRTLVFTAEQDVLHLRDSRARRKKKASTPPSGTNLMEKGRGGIWSHGLDSN